MLAYRITHKREDRLRHLIEAVGVEPAALGTLCTKASLLNIMLKNVKTSWANIIKQEMLACGGDAAISRHSYACKEQFTDVILMGTKAQLNRFVQKMKVQPDCFNVVADSVERILANKQAIIQVAGKTYDLDKDFMVIGILNVTPDSFSDGGKHFSYDAALKRAEELIKSGVDVIDIGGESTRPDSSKVSEEQEMERVLPVIEAVSKKLGAIVSIDSYKSRVVKEALKAGAKLVNDISSGSVVEPCIKEITSYNASIITMMNSSSDELRGCTPSTDTDFPEERFLDFCNSQRRALLGFGISEERMMFDPGVGFGMSVNDTSRVLNSIESSTTLGYAVCAGISRKSYVGKITGLNIDARDNVCNAISLYLMDRGVKIFRTHDPEGLGNVIKAYRALEGA